MMNCSARTYGALRVGLLIFALSAVAWPDTKYNSRLQLFGEVAVPASAQEITAAQTSKLLWSESAGDCLTVISLEASPLTTRYLKRQTHVYAAVPTDAGALLCAASRRERVVDIGDGPIRYASPATSRPADRGPPSLV
ncbi:MAG TPA: hypothetical protein VF553_12695 [Pyrinomonadaceae bacterium]